jgi:hypothetical protein
MPGLPRNPTNGSPAAKAVVLVAGMLAWLLAILLALPWIAPSAHAAESYDNCANFIDSLPTVISTQGVWCLRKDLATNLASGNAIEIQANNVTLDCNDFKIGGLAAGDSSTTRGITAYGVQNATIRHCNIRGFQIGIALSGGGHLVEDNRLDNNLANGIYSDNSEKLRVRRNAIYDTGSTVAAANRWPIGIDIHLGTADITDNVVDGVFTGSGTMYPVYGIRSDASGTLAGNRIANLKSADTVWAWGIYAYGKRVWVSGNQVLGAAAGTVAAGTAMPGYGIQAGLAYCTGNTVGGFKYDISCLDRGGNSSN